MHDKTTIVVAKLPNMTDPRGSGSTSMASASYHDSPRQCIMCLRSANVCEACQILKIGTKPSQCTACDVMPEVSGRMTSGIVLRARCNGSSLPAARSPSRRDRCNYCHKPLTQSRRSSDSPMTSMTSHSATRLAPSTKYPLTPNEILLR